MTINNPNYWRAGNYKQPVVSDPPNGQRANNARHAIWHFSRPVVFEFYPAGTWRKEDGRYDRGAARLITMYAVVQPFGGKGMLQYRRPEGDSFEAELVVHLDSHQPKNIEIANANPDIFTDGVFLAGVGQGANFDTRGFGMIMQFRNQRWRIANVDVFENAGDEEVSSVSAMHRGECTLFTDVQQEMNASRNNEIIAP